MAICSNARADLEVLGYQARLHDRFYIGPDKAFIAANQPWSRPGDWSGMGRFWDEGPNGLSYWEATMVSENYFITSGHVRPSRHYDTSEELPKVRFYRGDDPNGEYWESTIDIADGNWDYTTIDVPNADLSLVKLAQTPPDWVRRYPLVKRNQLTNWISFVDPTVMIFGISSPFTAYTSSRVGRNSIERRAGDLYTYDTVSPPGLGADEARSVFGGSSYPIMAITPAGPTLYSVISGVGVGPTMLDYHAAVQSLLAARGEQVAVVTDLLGDLDADYDVDGDDHAILQGHLALESGVSYANGDLNRDGLIDVVDEMLLAGQLGRVLRAPADFTHDNVISNEDLTFITSRYGEEVAPFANGDANGDGRVDRADLIVFNANRTDALPGAPPRQIAGDANFDGQVDSEDLQLWALNLYRLDVAEPYFVDGDTTGDRFVDFADLAVIRDNFGTIYADLDNDLRVDLSDIDIVLDQWGLTAPTDPRADLTGDGAVDAADLQAVASALGSSYRPPLPSRLAGLVPGDFTGDLFVDGADLLAWQRALGSTFAPAIDANKNGIVDAGDLAVWSSSAASQVANGAFAVPAPDSGGLAASGAVTLLLAARSRSQRLRYGRLRTKRCGGGMDLIDFAEWRG